MARKKYQIGFEIDSSKAEAAAKRVNAAMAQIDRNGAKAAAGLDRLVASYGNLGAAASAAANASKQGSQSAAAAANASAKSQAQQAAMAAKAKMQADALAAKAAVAAADRAARAYEGAANRAARAAQLAQAAQERAARQQQASTERAARAAQAAADKQVRDQARAAAAAQKAADATARAQARAQAAQDRLVTKSLTDQQVKQQALNALMRQSNKARVDGAIKAMDTEKQGFLESAASALGFEGALTKVGIATAALGAAIGAGRELAKAFNLARDASLDMAKHTLETKSNLREIAAIKEKFGPDKEELAQHIKVRVGSGLSHPEGAAWQTELFNSLGTVSEEKLSKDERAKLEIMGAQSAARTGGGVEGVSTRAGTMGLLADFMPGKGHKAEEVVDLADKIDVILGRGAGRPTQMAQQYRESLTTLGNDELKGKFKNPAEIASMVALVSKQNAGDAATVLGQTFRGLERFTKESKAKGADQSQAETLREAGIKEEDTPRQKLEKMFALVDKKGGTDNAVKVLLARMGFGSEQEKKGFETLYGEKKKGNYDAIMKLADEPVKAGAAAEKNRQFAASDVGRYQIAKAKLDAAKLGRGERGTEHEILKTEAEGELIAEGMDDTPWRRAKHAVLSAGTLFTREGRDVEIEQRMLANQRAKIRAKGGEVAPSRGDQSLGNLAMGVMGGPSGMVGAGASYMAGFMSENVFSDTTETVNIQQKQLDALNKLVAASEKDEQGGKAPATAPAANPQKGPPSTLGSAWQLMGW